MSEQSRRHDMRRMLQLVVVICLTSAVLTLAIGFWIPAKAKVAQYLLERAWDKERSGLAESKPWPWADTSPFARLTIPELDASWVVLSGATGRNLAFAPAHMDGSAIPGDAGVTVIAGHRDTHFAVLEQLRTGMDIVVEGSDGGSHQFRVTSLDIVDSTTTEIRLDAALPRLLLTTCYPFDAVTPGGPLRYVVVADALERGVDGQDNTDHRLLERDRT